MGIVLTARRSGHALAWPSGAEEEGRGAVGDASHVLCSARCSPPMKGGPAGRPAMLPLTLTFNVKEDVLLPRMCDLKCRLDSVPCSLPWPCRWPCRWLAGLQVHLVRRGRVISGAVPGPQALRLRDTVTR